MRVACVEKITRVACQMTSMSHDEFLCLCDELCRDDAAQSVTFTELLRWSDYVLTRPVRELYGEARKLFLVFRKLSTRDDAKQLQQLVYMHFVDKDEPSDVERFASEMKRSMKSEAIALWHKISTDIARATVKELAVEKINAYRLPPDPSLVQLSVIFETLGRYSHVLIDNPKYCELIHRYVAAFEAPTDRSAQQANDHQ